MVSSAEYSVIKPTTRMEVLHAIAEAIRNTDSLRLTLLGGHEVPTPREFDVAITILRISYSNERYLTLVGKTPTDNRIYVGVSQNYDVPIMATIID